MPRPSKDGRAARAARKRVLTEFTIARTKPEAAGAYNIWDLKEPGLVLRIQPSGHRAFKCVYSRQGKPRWYHVGLVPLSDARRIAAKIRLAVAEGRDPVADRKAERSSGSFAELADAYLVYAKRKNKSWPQARALVERNLLPRWGKLDAKTIARADVRQLMTRLAAAPVAANQTLAAASAIFSWGVREEMVAVNPCVGVERNETKSRERVLSDAEVKLFWDSVGTVGLLRSAALKTILLTGQRPGEVRFARREHIADSWWTMPGEPVPALRWPGTKNSKTHRVWLPQVVQDMIAAELTDDDSGTGFVFGGDRGAPVHGLDAAMRELCKAAGIEPKATPHDLRRTFGTAVTRLGFPRTAMDRLLNHAEGGPRSGAVYDRHQYAEENKRVMEAVAEHFLTLAGATEADAKVIRGSFTRRGD
jgi:integrase